MAVCEKPNLSVTCLASHDSAQRPISLLTCYLRSLKYKSLGIRMPNRKVNMTWKYKSKYRSTMCISWIFNFFLYLSDTISRINHHYLTSDFCIKVTTWSIIDINNSGWCGFKSYPTIKGLKITENLIINTWEPEPMHEPLPHRSSTILVYNYSLLAR